VPDVVEIDRLETGEHRGGLCCGLWWLAVKLSRALDTALWRSILQIYGYLPNVKRSPHTLLEIRLCLGPVPAALYATALPRLTCYPVSRAGHTRLLERLVEADARSGEE